MSSSCVLGKKKNSRKGKSARGGKRSDVGLNGTLENYVSVVFKSKENRRPIPMSEIKTKYDLISMTGEFDGSKDRLNGVYMVMDKNIKRNKSKAKTVRNTAIKPTPRKRKATKMTKSATKQNKLNAIAAAIADSVNFRGRVK